MNIVKHGCAFFYQLKITQKLVFCYFWLLLLSTRTLPSWIFSLKKSFTEQPALPEEAQAHAHAQDDAQAQDEAHEDAQDDAQEERCDDPLLLLDECELLTGTFTTFTWI